MKEWLITPPEEFLKRLNNNKAGKPFDARDLVFGEGYTPNNVKRLIDATNSKALNGSPVNLRCVLKA